MRLLDNHPDMPHVSGGLLSAMRSLDPALRVKWDPQGQRYIIVEHRDRFGDVNLLSVRPPIDGRVISALLAQDASPVRGVRRWLERQEREERDARERQEQQDKGAIDTIVHDAAKSPLGHPRW